MNRDDSSIFYKCTISTSNLFKDKIYLHRVADALATLGCQQDAFNLFEAPPLGVDQLCSFDSSGVTTPRIISM
jgi:hypothetical protein